MLFHLFKFSVFLLVLMVGFALAFHSLFSLCTDGEDMLGEAFGDFWHSLLFMFDAMLGSPGFDMFQNGQCEGPAWVLDAGLLLMVVYLVFMIILLLNLLIAVLSTVHADMNINAESEYHLARTSIILKSRQSVEQDRVPPPLNILMAALGALVDIFGFLLHFITYLCW